VTPINHRVRPHEQRSRGRGTRRALGGAQRPGETVEAGCILVPFCFCVCVRGWLGDSCFAGQQQQSCVYISCLRAAAAGVAVVRRRPRVAPVFCIS
jgi:hypothetical protein